MKCSKCGYILQDGMAFCPVCQSQLKNKKSKKKIIVVFVISFAVLILTGITAFFAISQFSKQNRDSITADNCEEVYDQYQEINNLYLDIENNYVNEDGFVAVDDVDLALAEIEKVAKEYKKCGDIKDYSIEDTSVYMTLSSGVGYLYSLNIEGVMAGDEVENIITIEPFCYSAETIVNYLFSGRSPDKSAKEIADLFPNDYAFNKSNNLDSFALDDVSKLADKKIIIWYGHGGYTNATGSVLSTSIEIKDKNSLGDYSIELDKNEIILGKKHFLLTPVYFEKHFKNNDFKDAIVYLASCASAKDRRLANVFIDKGASVVLGNTDTVSIRYNLYMMSDFFTGLTKTNSSGSYYSVKEALEYAIDENGEKDGEFLFYGSEVVTLGDDTISLQNKESKPENTEETAQPSTQSITEQKTEPTTEAPTEEVTVNDTKIVMTDFEGSTVGDIVAMYGDDFNISQGLYRGGWGYIYYKDGRSKLLYYYKCNASDRGKPVSYDTKIVGVNYSVGEIYDEYYTADNAPVSMDYTQLMKFSSGKNADFSENFVDGGYCLSFDYNSDISICCYWYADDYSGIPDAIEVHFKKSF